MEVVWRHDAVLWSGPTPSLKQWGLLCRTVPDWVWGGPEGWPSLTCESHALLQMHSTSSNLSPPLPACGILLSSLPPRFGLFFGPVTAEQSPLLPWTSCYHCPMQTMRFILPIDLSEEPAVGDGRAAGLALLTALSSSRTITKCDSAGGWSGCNLRLLTGSTEQVKCFKRQLCRKLPQTLPATEMGR